MDTHEYLALTGRRLAHAARTMPGRRRVIALGVAVTAGALHGQASGPAGPSLPAPSWRRALVDARHDPRRVSASLTQSIATYTASHNEPMDGAFATLSVQVAQPIVRVKGVTVAYLGEALPFMRTVSEAPPDRRPLAGVDPDANDPQVVARYARHQAYGVGLAPLGAEATQTLRGGYRVVVNVTAGAAWFSRVVPYGRATQANFTVAPGLLIERPMGARGAVAAGYALHHLSNASMGGANPGMNSHLLTLRWTRSGAAR